MDIDLPKRTLVIGGAASGKSRYAEKLVIETGRPRNYIATAQAFDSEMVTKVAKHKTQRGAGWEIFEEPFEPWNAFANITPPNVILLDCATFWLSNILLEGRDLASAKETFFNGIEANSAHIVIVTNEVGMGVVPDNRLARQFRQEQGELNQKLAALCDLVVFVTAGLPMALKGQLPE